MGKRMFQPGCGLKWAGHMEENGRRMEGRGKRLYRGLKGSGEGKRMRAKYKKGWRF